LNDQSRLDRRYEHQLVVAEGDYVIVHGRFSGNGRPVAWIAADIVRIEDGRLAEHWGPARRGDRTRIEERPAREIPLTLGLLRSLLQC
jgi:predicted SnoaL-like aldol condensation-catalyzing enzyme